MNVDAFKSYVENNNRVWLSNTINVPIANHKGIDLLDDFSNRR